MGRGRLNQIELLPEECSPVVAWAADELQKRDRTQTDIYQEFVSKLQQLDQEFRGELEVKIPSFTAFNRYSIRLSVITQRLNETREIATTIAAKFDPQASNDLTLIAAEAIKTLIFEILTSAGESGVVPKDAMALANALRAAAQAQGVSVATRQKIEAEFAEKAKKAVNSVARSKGLSDEAAAEILIKILGVQK